jgi:hypothetical protein
VSPGTRVKPRHNCQAAPPTAATTAENGWRTCVRAAPYSKSVRTLFARAQQQASLCEPERFRGKIVVSEGFAFAAKILEFEREGAIHRAGDYAFNNIGISSFFMFSSRCQTRSGPRRATIRSDARYRRSLRALPKHG